MKKVKQYGPSLFEQTLSQEPGTSINLDIEKSRLARDEGIEKAIAHADKVIYNWGYKAYLLLQEFIKTKHEFLVEDFRLYCEQQKLETPPDNRAFGGIILKAKRAGLVMSLRYESCKNKIGHRHPVSVWIKI